MTISSLAHLARPGLVLLASLLCSSCHRKDSASTFGTELDAGSTATPVDHLATNELASGTAEIWGFAVPREMHIVHHYLDVAYISGPVKADSVSNYVRDRLIVAHVEIGAGRTTFPNARIKAGAADRVYQFDVIPEAGGTRLTIHDLTPPKITPGLSDAERWRQAGLTPQGRPLDMKKFE